MVDKSKVILEIIKERRTIRRYKDKPKGSHYQRR